MADADLCFPLSPDFTLNRNVRFRPQSGHSGWCRILDLCDDSARTTPSLIQFGMVNKQASWLAVAADLGVQIIAPYTVELGECHVTFAALFPQFGGPSGIVADPEWSVIKPYVALLALAGFRYSCVDLSGSNHENMREMLTDWGWTGAPENKPGWL